MKWAGLSLAMIIAIADQASKAGMKALLDARGPMIELTTFVNLVPVWNRGISFGLLGDGTVPVWVITTITAIITMILIIWLMHGHHHHRLSAIALGTLIGGALGNLIDRLRFGAVFDFLDFHLADWHWPAFNLADSAIVLGAVGLALISMRPTDIKSLASDT